MNTQILPPHVKDWAEAQVAAGRAPSLEALAADALAALKAQQDAIATKLALAKANAEQNGWIDGENALSKVRAWIAEDEAEDAATD
jgi:hypothetical protein